MASELDSFESIGSQRQLLLSTDQIEKMEGGRLVLHQPRRENFAIQPDKPWESGGVSTMVAFKDGDRFRAWYRCDPAKEYDDYKIYTAYAESRDGIHWSKPNLGIVEFEGSTENNLAWSGPGGNMSPIKDPRPGVPSSKRYKAIVRGYDEGPELYALESPDGIHWRLAKEEPIRSDQPFDSHNILIWDPVREEFVIYARSIRYEGKLGVGMSADFGHQFGKDEDGVRWVRRSTSKDFKSWSPWESIQTGYAPMEQFYTNSAIIYPRATQYTLLFPSRFANTREPKENWEYGKGVNDVVLLSSRDGLNFDRTFMEAFVRPGLSQDNWHERALYMERGLLSTGENEYSIYGMEGWRTGSNGIRRFSIRKDGFISFQAPYQGGELITRPFYFSGNRLNVNFSTSAVGSLKVEIQDKWGNPLPGFTLEDSIPLLGDSINRTVEWNSGADVDEVKETPVRLRFVIRDGDLFSYKFDEVP